MLIYDESILLKEEVTKKWYTELCDLCVQNIFKACFRTTSDSTINWLKYRILHSILPVKYLSGDNHIYFFWLLFFLQ